MKSILVPMFLVLSLVQLSLMDSSIDGNNGANGGLPCVKRFNQLYCDQPGTYYPMNLIDGYIDDNKQLMRRMYGSLVREDPPPPPEETPQTPASTMFVRNVRDFGGLRFSRSVGEGYLEDLLLQDEYYQNLDSNFTSFSESDDDTYSFSVRYGGYRKKRQAGFPGADKKTDTTNKIDACEARTEVTTPFWATNNNGQVRAIVNTKNFEQAVHQEICSTSRTLRCAGDCQCEQKYKWHRLLAYDPNNDCNGVFMDWFLFPSCCACRCLKNPLAAS